MVNNQIKLLALERLFAEEGTLPDYLFKVYQKLLKKTNDERMYVKAPDIQGEKMYIEAPNIQDNAMYKEVENEDLHIVSETVSR